MKKVVAFFVFVLLVGIILIFNQKMRANNGLSSTTTEADGSFKDAMELEKDRVLPPFFNPKESSVSSISDTLTVEWYDQNNRIQIFTQSPNKDGSMYTINQLTFEENADATDAAWSPDMQKIAFFISRIESEGRIYDLYVMNSDGSNKTLLFSRLDHSFPVSWSPDNKKILIVLPLDDNNPLSESGIYELSIDGANKNLLYSGGYVLYKSPQYSPDGSKILFSRDNNKLGDNVYLYDVYVLDLKTKISQRLTDNKSDYMNTSDYWSPDGKKISFTSISIHKNMGSICIMDIDGNNQKCITSDDIGAFSYSWSPDSRKIAFTAAVPRMDIPNWEICIVDVDGNNAVRLTDNTIDDSNPVWSLDGKVLFYLSDNRLHAMNSDGSGKAKFVFKPVRRFTVNKTIH